MPKSKYQDYVEPHLDLIAAWCRDGVPETKMAEKLGVGITAWKNYKKRYVALEAALARTKELVDCVEMVGAYKRRAEGYTTIEHIRTWKIETDPVTGEQVRILKEEKEMEKHVPGDARALENWLQLRMPEAWRHKAEDEAAGPAGGGVVFIPAKVMPEAPVETIPVEARDLGPVVDKEPVDKVEGGQDGK